ncbi:MAG: sugar-binding transcriptional regulator [Chloroflexota bacterium]
MAQIDELRLMTKVARLYYDREMRQGEIADQMGLSQATISRLLTNAREAGIIRITVNIPNGVNAEIEEQLIQKFSLKEAIVVDCENDLDETLIQREIGAAAAYHVETLIHNNDVVGISSWSATLLALVDAMRPVPGRKGIQVVQILGGIGNPSAEVHANRLTGRFASLVNGSAHFLPVPGIVGSEAALKVLLADQYVQEGVQLFDQVTIALVGIGDIEPSKLLTLSGNVFSLEEQEVLRGKGAVGDILLRFFNAHGKPVKGPLSNRVVSMSLEQLTRVDRAIAVAGGIRKYKAILGALRGKWINVLVTDRCTAERLVQET